MKKILVIALGLVLLLPMGSFADNTGESLLVGADGKRECRMFYQMLKTKEGKA
jgi:hypothetical protein